MPEIRNYPVADLIRMAEEVLLKYKSDHVMSARVYFKATCPKCKERCEFVEPNTHYETMECATCGNKFPFVEGGIKLELVKRDMRGLN